MRRLIIKYLEILVLCILLFFNSILLPGELFEHLNLDYPGLEKTRVAVNSGDFAQAQIELLNYFRTKSSRIMPEMKFEGDISKADMNSRNAVDIKSVLHEFHERIDWKRVEADKEWQFSLNRMNWFLNYVGAYQKTGDEKYMHAWMDQVKSWIALGDPGYPRTIDSGRRLDNWLVSWYMFVKKLQSASVTPDFNADMLYSMYQQAEFLADPAHWRRYSNWGTFENSGFVFFVLMFPEFKLNEQWVKEAFFRMRFQLENSFYPDGMHIEVSPSYHSHEMQVLFRFIQTADLNHIENPWRPQIPMPSMQHLLLNTARAAMHWVKPTGFYPQLGDTDKADERWLLENMGKVFEYPELIYVASNGCKGTKPEKTSVSFPDGGYHIMRSGWGNQERAFDKELYLLFDTNTNQPWHAHFDMLNIVVTAFGHDLLKDPGRFTYNETDERDYFKSTRSHNTLVIDGKNQQRYCTPFLQRWHSLGGFDYVSASHQGYPGITHTRSIFFVKPEYWIVVDRIDGKGTHELDQYWHLSPDALDQIDIDTTNQQLKTPHLLISYLGKDTQARLELGDLSYSYREKIKAPVIITGKKQQLPSVMVTQLFPYREKSPDLVSEMTSPVAAAADQAVFITNKSLQYTDIFIERCSNRTPFSCKEFQTDALAAFIRFDQQKKVTALYLIQGTYLKTANSLFLEIDGAPAEVSFANDQIHIESDYISDFHMMTQTTSQVKLNGKEIDVHYENNRISLKPAKIHNNKRRTLE